MDTLERIFELADKIFPEQQEFASALGVKPSIVSQWRNKITKSYERRLPKIAKVLGTSVEYLTTGEEKKPAPITESGLDATKYHMHNEENRALVDQMIEKLLKSQSGE